MCRPRHLAFKLHEFHGTVQRVNYYYTAWQRYPVRVPSGAITMKCQETAQSFLEYENDYLILLEICPDSPAFVVRKCVSVFLEKSVNPGNTTVPRVFKILESKPSVLCCSFLSFESIFCPHTLWVNELCFPWLDIPETHFISNTVLN